MHVRFIGGGTFFGSSPENRRFISLNHAKVEIQPLVGNFVVSPSNTETPSEETESATTLVPWSSSGMPGGLAPETGELMHLHDGQPLRAAEHMARTLLASWMSCSRAGETHHS